MDSLGFQDTLLTERILFYIRMPAKLNRATQEYNFGVRKLAFAFESGGKPPHSIYIGTDDSFKNIERQVGQTVTKNKPLGFWKFFNLIQNPVKCVVILSENRCVYQKFKRRLKPATTNFKW